jgi:3-hydroxyisobutyrate dehydrogenase-like beta-hydroxyacid dehydrogenase
MTTKNGAYQTKKIGIIGLGTMGGNIADKFIKKGYQVFICDINKKIVKKYIDKGAIVCSTPKKLTQEADIVFEITINDETSREVWESSEGILSGATNNKILIASATLSAAWVDELAKKCNNAGFIFFDMAMTGPYNKITLLCGGDKKELKELKPILRAFAGKIRYFGQQGQGIRYKLILNFLQAVQIIGFGQAMKIAHAENMDIDTVITALSEKISDTTACFTEEMFEKEFESSLFTIGGITKDLTYAKKLSKNLDISILDDVLSKYKNASNKGYAKKDWLSINLLDNL